MSRGPAVRRIGLIADTHGLLRPEAVAFLRGADFIVHAGDIGSGAILDALAALAPVTAVRGNNDVAPWAEGLPDSARLVVDGVVLHVLHDLADLRRLPAPPDARVIVTGHSHQPRIDERGGLLQVNPGSAGPRRFRLPISAGELLIDGVEVRARTVVLADGQAPNGAHHR